MWLFSVLPLPIVVIHKAWHYTLLFRIVFITSQATLIAGRGRVRYQNVWIVLLKFTYTVSSLVPAQMIVPCSKKKLANQSLNVKAFFLFSLALCWSTLTEVLEYCWFFNSVVDLLEASFYSWVQIHSHSCVSGGVVALAFLKAFLGI